MHNYSFTSTKHLDVASASALPSPAGRFLSAPKYTICSFTPLEVSILREIYLKDCPTLFANGVDSFFSRSFQKMAYVTIDGQKVKMGHYILAKYVFQFTTNPPSSVDSSFSLADARPAKIDYIFKHSVQVHGNLICKMIAAVSWPMQHPLQHVIGKPYEVWCASAYEMCNKNSIVPLSNFLTLLLTAQQTINGQHVLTTVPIIL